MTPDIVISGTGLYTPPASISNQELVDAFNAWVAAAAAPSAVPLVSMGIRLKRGSAKIGRAHV